ncbi:hypothetical protein [Sphaerotilus mobilis]|uniref:Uncharacterized protein n=1 Tax=Sphaerotilus mobilis TaxID=47994 RepID=A0A4Q7LUF9_9BURK|nr:hypothetical protein [Sphaerotilus mobilis]RZS58756.1 hypothetical protein EV685_1056 [Sphaerotilus mobilis]
MPAAAFETKVAVLVTQVLSPCLQVAHAAGKNTSDIALALDATVALATPADATGTPTTS